MQVDAGVVRDARLGAPDRYQGIASIAFDYVLAFGPRWHGSLGGSYSIASRLHEPPVHMLLMALSLQSHVGRYGK
jgi:hypothetical protein